MRKSNEQIEQEAMRGDELVYISTAEGGERIVPLAGLEKEWPRLREAGGASFAFFHDEKLSFRQVRQLVREKQKSVGAGSHELGVLVHGEAAPGAIDWYEESGEMARQRLERLRAFVETSGGVSGLGDDEVFFVRDSELLRPPPNEQSAPLSLQDWIAEGQAMASQQSASTIQRLLGTRQEIIDNVAMLDAGALATLRGSQAAEPRALAKRWRDSGEILGVKVGREFRYPEFQFDPATGQPRAVMPELLARVRGQRDARTDPDGWRAMHWFYAKTGLLSGDRPYRVIETEPDRVLNAARRQFADADSLSAAAG